MKYDPEKHHRHSIRLKGYDYSQPGGYVVTIVTQNRECLFGDVADGKMVLNGFGEIIEYYWQRLPQHFKHIKLDVFQIMPNHLHGIIIITDPNVGAMHSRNEIVNQNRKSIRNASPLQKRPHGTQPGSLPAIVQNFESVTTRKINHIRKTPGQKLWQRNYWEHIIRDDNDFNRICEYIINNPLQWESDDENPGKP